MDNKFQVQQYVPLKKSSATVITQKTSGDILAILGANATTFTLGDATHEGGDLIIYRDGSANTQLTIDADAASNAKAVDIYGGVVCQNYLTVGQTTLSTLYPLLVNGVVRCTYPLIDAGSAVSCGANGSSVGVNVPVSGTDATDHEAQLQIDSNVVFGAKGTGDGAGGATNLKCIAYAPLFLAGTPQTLSGAGAVNLTTSTTHVVTASGPNALTLADGAEGQCKMIVMKTDDGDGVLTPTNLANGTTVTFDDVGDSAFLFFTNSAWHFMGGTATLA